MFIFIVSDPLGLTNMFKTFLSLWNICKDSFSNILNLALFTCLYFCLYWSFAAFLCIWASPTVSQAEYITRSSTEGPAGCTEHICNIICSRVCVCVFVFVLPTVLACVCVCVFVFCLFVLYMWGPKPEFSLTVWALTVFCGDKILDPTTWTLNFRVKT